MVQICILMKIMMLLILQKHSNSQIPLKWGMVDHYQTPKTNKKVYFTIQLHLAAAAELNPVPVTELF